MPGTWATEDLEAEEEAKLFAALAQASDRFGDVAANEERDFAALDAAPVAAPAAPTAQAMSTSTSSSTTTRDPDPWHTPGTPGPLSREPKDAAQYIWKPAAESQGALADYLGHDEEAALAPLEARRAQVQQALANRPREDAFAALQPGHYEQQFLAENVRPTNEDINRMVIMNRMFGRKGDEQTAYQMAIHAQSSFDHGLQQARAMDAKTRPGRLVDDATVEALVEYGLTPESAAQVRVGSPVLDLMKQKLASLEREKMIRKTEETKMEGATDLVVGRNNNVTSAENNAATNEARAALAKLKADSKAKGAGGGGKTPEDIARQLVRDYELDPARLAAVTQLVQGKPPEGAFTPEELAKLNLQAGTYLRMPGKDWREVVKKSSVAIDTTGNRDVAADKTAQRQKDMAQFKSRMLNAKEQIAFKTEGKSAFQDVRNAWAGLKAIEANPAYAAIFFGYGADPNDAGAFTGENFLKFVRSQGVPEAEARKLAGAGGAIWRAVNTVTAARSGKAVTNGEWARIAREVGLPVGLDVGNAETGPAQFREFLRATMANLEMKRSVYNETVSNDQMDWK